MVGLVLWVLVFVAGFVAWRTTADRSEPAANDVAAEAIPEGESAQSPDGAKPIVLKPQAAPEATPSGWDAEGIDEFALTERSGRTITKDDLLGKPWAVCFVFTTCAGPCMGISAQMKELSEQLADEDVRFVTITVNPDYDTPEILTRYADAFGADPQKWWFLTGDKRQIYELIERSFKMPVKEMQGEDRKPGWEVLHTTNILLVDASGRVVDKFNGTSDTDMVALRKAMQSLAAGPVAGEALAREPVEAQRPAGPDVEEPEDT